MIRRIIASVTAVVLTLCVIFLPQSSTGAAGAQNALKLPETIDFNRDIRPILSDNCYACHGPDKNKRQAGLRLDTKDGIFGKIDDINPVVPGNLDDSILYMRITSDDPEYRMPEPRSNKTLAPRQIALIKKWIEQGAPWKGHWAYEPASRPEAPKVAANPFVRNDIDKFILTRLNEEGLKPAQEADRVTLLRRLSFDLTGLPPTTQEVEDFLDDSSPEAYASVVTRLLSSPRYGERMAVYWLDLVRYADTVGYHSDVNREVWPYRDYVIKAFNANKPFNQFTVEQIAGDLLPNSTTEQKVASGYNRLLETTEEGGAQPKEYEVKNLVDRVRNISSAWMGATMGCCQCHDHKFDPYSSKDFYRMGAFFADVKEEAIGPRVPELMLPDEKQTAELARMDGEIAVVKTKLDTPSPQLALEQQRWEQEYKSHVATDWTVLRPMTMQSEGGATFTANSEGIISVSGQNPAVDTYFIKAKTTLAGMTGFRLEVFPDGALPAAGPGRSPNGNFVLTGFSVQRAVASTQPAMPLAEDYPSSHIAAMNSIVNRERIIPLKDATASFEQTRGVEGIPQGKWAAALAIDPKKNDSKYGWAILPYIGKENHAVFQTAEDFGGGKEVELTFALHFDFGDQHSIGKFRLSATNDLRPVKARPVVDEVPKNIAELVKIDSEERAPAQKEKVAKFYRSIAPSLQPVRTELAAKEKEKAELLKVVPKTMISISAPPRVVRVLHRGNWQDESGEVVTPAVPHFLKQIDAKGRSANRLDLAKWLVSRDNPMTARVFVNRLWKIHFGQGLARTLDDLGSQGEWPTHPELLDYLATEFMDSGWDVKHMVKLIVMSGAYRQSSHAEKTVVDADPYNRWWARQGRFRLDAEFVRDNALAVSGLLVEKLGGPSVRPYQPEGYWEFLNFPKRTWVPDKGPAEYRRGLYTHWQRTFLHPSLVNFDASSREECVAQRVISNTPQQALTLLNDPTYVEAAKLFAGEIVKNCNGDEKQRIDWAYHQALSRAPTTQETAVLSALFEKHKKEFATSQPAAKELLAVGETPVAVNDDAADLAAWTSVARVILNLHETITRN